MSTLQERLKEVMDDLGITTQKDFATFAGVSKGLVNQWFSGTSTLGLKPIINITKKTNYSAEWLSRGVGPKYVSQSNISDGPSIRGKVPVISWVQAGSYVEAIDLFQPGDADEWTETTVNVGPHTFAVRVVGDSMMDKFPPLIMRYYKSNNIVYLTFIIDFWFRLLYYSLHQHRTTHPTDESEPSEGD